MMRRRRDLPPVAPQPWAALVPPDSFYARLAGLRDVLVDDGDYVALYKDSVRGRPSIPPSLVVLAMLLQYHDDCSDPEAEQRLRFDLRWKHALGLALEDGGFDATVLGAAALSAGGAVLVALLGSASRGRPGLPTSGRVVR